LKYKVFFLRKTSPHTHIFNYIKNIPLAKLQFPVCWKLQPLRADCTALASDTVIM